MNSTNSFPGLFSPIEVVSTNNLLRIEQDQCKIQMTRLYYSSIFKAFYLLLIILSVLCICVTLLQMFDHSKLLISLESFVTLMLGFEIFYRMYMQSCRVYLEQKWNVLDVVVVFVSIGLLWVGIEIRGGIGEIDTVTALLMIIARSVVMVLRLVLSIKKKKDQEVQIIDLNDMSEVDEVGGKKVKREKGGHSKFEEEEKCEYQESQIDV